jgi:hypothetical protein
VIWSVLYGNMQQLTMISEVSVASLLEHIKMGCSAILDHPEGKILPLPAVRLVEKSFKLRETRKTLCTTTKVVRLSVTV